MNIMPQIIKTLKFKKPAIWFVESILAYNFRWFLPDMQFSQNQYGASFKAQKVMLPSLKCQIFRFWSKFISFTQLSK